MFIEINHLVCEITTELCTLGKVSKNSEIYNCRLKLLNSIKETIQQHRKDMKRISHRHEQLYNARELELQNKESEKEEDMRLQYVKNYISYRDGHNNILNKDLKLMYDNNINIFTKKIDNVYMEINKLNDHYNNISCAHSAAVQHAVRQAVKQEEIRINIYNQKQYERNFLVNELICICNLEQAHIVQVNEFNHNHIQKAYPYTPYQQAVYQHANYHKTVNTNLAYQQAVYQHTIDSNKTYSQKIEQELEHELEQELKLEQELELELELELEIELEIEKEQKLNEQQFSITFELLDMID
jgi:hypothetical protein